MPPKVVDAIPGQFTPGQKVTVSGRTGVVKFFGVTQFAAGVWVGIALDDKVGKNDGSVQGVVYFECEANHGIFVRPANVLAAGQAPTPKADGVAPAAAAATAAAPPKQPAVAKADGVAPASVATASVTPKLPAVAVQPPPAVASPAASSPPTSPTSAKSGASAAAPAKAAASAPTAKAAASGAKPAAPAPAPAAAAPGAAVSKAPGTDAPAAAAAAAVSLGRQSVAKAAGAEAAAPAKAPSGPFAPAKAAPAAVPPVAPAAAAATAKATPAKAAAEAVTSAAPAKAPSTAAKAAAAAPAGAVAPTKPAAGKAAGGDDAADAAAEAKLQREITELTAEARRLEKVLEDTNSEIAELTRRGDELEEETRQAERMRQEAAKSQSAKNAELEALLQQLEAAKAEESELLSQQKALEAEKLELQRQTDALQKASLEGAAPAAGEATGLDKQQLLAIEKVRNQIALEKDLQELAELELEEVNLNIEDAKAALEDASGADQLSEAQQILWHKKALYAFFDEHRAEMRRLRRRQGALERAQQASQSKHQTEDLSVLRRTVDQLTHQIEQLKQQNEGLRQQVEERQRLRNDSNEMCSVQDELEAALLEELEWKRNREAQLEALARQLYVGQGELRRRRAEERGKVARLETRLRNLEMQRRAAADMGETGQGARPQDGERCDEFTAALAAADAEAAAVEAEAWEACIPPSLLEEAELGRSFRSICALHNCMHKAQLLSRSIHENYVEDAVLPTLQADLPMRWLCSACIVGCEIAYEAVGVLGRLHAAEVSRYSALIRKPAVVACADGERALDSALSAVLLVLEEGAGLVMPMTPEERGLPEILSGLTAQCAQLRSLQTTAFKDEPFVSWQSAGFAVEALRAACASALYASDDAGGSRLQRWQALYTRAHALARRLAPHTQAPIADKGVLTVEPGQSPPMRRKRVQTEDGGTTLDPDESAVELDERDPDVLAAEGHLTKGLLDALLRQASILLACAWSEPKDDAGIAKLEKAFAVAEGHIEGLDAVIKSRADGPEGPLPLASWPPTPPWELAREAARERIEQAQGEAPAQKERAEQQLREVDDALAAAEMQLAAMKAEVEQAEREYSVARLDADRLNLAEAQVARMQNQVKSGEEQRKRLEEELKQETELLARMEAATAETRKTCRDLQVQIAEAEKRLQKRYNSQVPVEEVVALRRSCVRQQHEIAAFMKRFFGGDALDPMQKPSMGDPSLEQDGSAGGGERKRTSLVSLKSNRSLRSTKSGRAEALQRHISAESCWRDLQETQKDLLLEQAGTTLVNVEDPHPEMIQEMKRNRLMDLARTSIEVRGDITALLREAADPAHRRRQKHMDAQFASVALTRFLKESAAAAERGPAARVSVPAPAAMPESMKLLGLQPSVPVLADLNEFLSLHHALL